ncbi:hypothetical protein J3F84DRAFT_375958 [Trichoderma pleuroticola]
MHMHAHHPSNQPPASTCIFHYCTSSYFWDMHEKCQAPTRALIQSIPSSKDLIRGSNQRPNWAETLQPASANYESLDPERYDANESEIRSTGLGSRKSKHRQALVQNSTRTRAAFASQNTPAVKDPPGSVNDSRH